MLNTVPEALADAARAGEILTGSGEQELLLRLEFQTAYVTNYLGNQPEALERYRSALRIADALGEAGEMYYGLIFTNMGSGYEALGDWRQALDYYERAREAFRQRGDELYLASVETNIAYIAQAQGNYRRAIQMLERSLEQASEHSDLEVTRIRWHLLECYLGLNRLEESPRRWRRQIVAENERMSDAFELARAQVYLATIEAGLGSYEAARAELDQAETIFTTLGAAPWIGTVGLRRGRLALQQGDPQLAHQLALKAAAAFETAGQRVNGATARLLEGQSLLASGELQGGEAAGEAALRVAQHENVPALRYSAHLALGRIHESRAAPGRAERHYRAAAATIERVQRGLTITLQPGFLEDKNEASRALIGLQLRQGRTESAFETLERAKSQVLLGYLANRERLRWAREDPSSQALIEELDQLRAEHHLLHRQAVTIEDGAHPPAAMEPAQAVARVNALERRMRAITEKLYLLSAGEKAAAPTMAPTCEAIQSSLDENSLLVEYSNDGAQMVAFLLDGTSIEVQMLPMGCGSWICSWRSCRPTWRRRSKWDPARRPA